MMFLAGVVCGAGLVVIFAIAAIAASGTSTNRRFPK
jgi:hypothetical protein